mmetsp:Transcript_83667/g.234395  ORF Transcript_83667/g.234395 Transcript_83667/m.234395 type:complete len:383 (-) Transcript_83667:148-1296(-)
MVKKSRRRRHGSARADPHGVCGGALGPRRPSGLRAPGALRRSAFQRLVLHRLTSARPRLRLPARALGHEVHEVLVELLGHRRRRVRHRDVPQCASNVVERPVAPRLLRRGHFDDRATETPNIGFPPMAVLLQDHLGRHPWHGAHRPQRLRVVAPLRATEVCELHPEIQVHEHVRPLDVAMHDRRAPRVQVHQALQQATTGQPKRFVVQGTKFLEDRRHRAARHVLQVDVQRVVDVVVAKVAYDVGVAQRLADVELLLEAAPEHAVTLVVVEHRLLHRKDLAMLTQGREDAPIGPRADFRPALPMLTADVAEVAAARRCRGGRRQGVAVRNAGRVSRLDGGRRRASHRKGRRELLVPSPVAMRGAARLVVVRRPVIAAKALRV